MAKQKIIILGAGGRDFHCFNTVFRGNKNYEVVAFTASQIPGITGRRYPKELAGKGYPDGILILPEEKLLEIIKKENIDIVVLSYSDLSHQEVMHKASLVLAAGADFWLLGSNKTMLVSKKPVISVCAVRTGSGKSPASRRIIELLHKVRLGLRVVVIRHPMPYGDLKKQTVQRFSSFEDLKSNNCTIEEIEEYLPHIERGTTVYAGVDYEKILKAAEKEADLIVFDGGNNDTPFIKPDLHVVIADARRSGHEVSYHPGETNLRMADVVIINKVSRAELRDVDVIVQNIKNVNPKASIIKSDLIISTESTLDLKSKRILAVEDGPTLTHGGLASGAATLFAERNGAYTVNPRNYAVGSIKQIYSAYPHLGAVLPAMGYSQSQIKELEETINATPADVVVIGTPADLRQFLNINKPAVKVKYELKEFGQELENILLEFLRRGGRIR